MKYKVITLTTACFLAITALIFNSCNKQTEKDIDTSAGDDTALLERDNDDVYSITDQAADGSLIQYKQIRGACDTIIRDTLSTPRTVTVDFGPTNCLCSDGKYRRGKIIRSYTGKYKQVGSVHTITTDGYAVNDNQIFATKTVTNNGLNANNNLNFTVTANDSVVKANNAGIVTWMSTRNREWFSGDSTKQWNDDKYSITGNGSGVKKNGIAWTMNITQPLIVDHSCIYRIISGELQIQPQGKALRTVNYGAGTCDNDATVTINGVVKNIKFK